jgi:hypothetical protein
MEAAGIGPCLSTLECQQLEHPQPQCRIRVFREMVQNTKGLHLPYRTVGLYVRMLSNTIFQLTLGNFHQPIHPEQLLQTE